MKNTEKKIRFGIIDVAVILAVCVLLVGVVLRYGLSGTWGEASELEQYTLSFVIFDKNPDSVNGLGEGDEIYFKDSGNYLGTVDSGVSVMPAEKFVELPDGEIAKVTAVDGKVDVRGTMTVKGRYKSGEGFFQNGTTFMAPGGKVEVYTAESDFTILVLDISKSDDLVFLKNY